MKRILSLALAGALSLCMISAAPAAQGSGCMPTTGTVSGLTFAQKVNDAIAALLSSNSGASAPATDCTEVAIKGQLWLDTSVTPNLLKQYTGAAWVALGALDASQGLWSPPVGGGAASVTAASTTDICAAPAAVQNISGVTTITSFGSACPIGVRKTLIFGAATPITYHATSMILPGQRSYTAAAGDVAEAIYLGSGNWRVITITKIDGSSVVNPSIPLATVLYGAFPNIPAKTVIGDGRALSRASYPDYLAAVTRVQTGTLTSGNNTITSVGNTRGLGAGMPIEGTGIPSGATIASVTSSTIVMSTNATANGSQSVTVFPTGYGSGGDSTTVGVQNCIGKVLAGLDPSAASLSGASAINSTQGNKSLTLARSDLPNTSVTVAITDPGHFHILQTDSQTSSAGSDRVINVSTPNVAVNTSAAFTGISAAFNLNGSVTQTLPSLVQPTVISECVVAVLP